MSLVSDAVHHAESRNRAVTDIVGAGNFPHQFVVNHAGILHRISGPEKSRSFNGLILVRNS